MTAAARRGVVAIIRRDERFLVIRRSATVAAPLAYCFPGGHIEPGESEEAAVCRELAEELSAQIRPIRRVWSSVTPWGIELAWWLADLTGDVCPNPAEVDSVYWLAAEEMAALPTLLESNRALLRLLASGGIDLGGPGLGGDRCVTRAEPDAR